MLVTVIIPVFNTNVKYLQMCFDSIRNQTYLDFECIVVDDCSTQEATRLFVKEYVKNQPNFKLFMLKKNIGLGPARNFGVEKSNGQIIVFLDSDDYLVPDALEDINSAFLKNPILDFYWFNYTQLVNGKFLQPGNFTFQTGIVNIETFKNAFIIPKMAWSKAYSRKFLTLNKITFINKKLNFEDVHYNIVVLSKAKNFLFSKKSNYIYHRVYNSLSLSAFTIIKSRDLLENVERAYFDTKNDNSYISKKYYKLFDFFFFYEMSLNKYDKNNPEFVELMNQALEFKSMLVEQNKNQK